MELKTNLMKRNKPANVALLAFSWTLERIGALLGWPTEPVLALMRRADDLFGELSRLREAQVRSWNPATRSAATRQGSASHLTGNRPQPSRWAAGTSPSSCKAVSRPLASIVVAYALTGQ